MSDEYGSSALTNVYRDSYGRVCWTRDGREYRSDQSGFGVYVWGGEHNPNWRQIAGTTNHSTQLDRAHTILRHQDAAKAKNEAAEISAGIDRPAE